MAQAQHPTKPSDDMKRFVYEAIRALVEHTEEIVIEERVDANAVQLTVSVHPSDFGRVIGQGGKTIQAVRILIAAICSRLHIRCALEVADPPRSSIN